MLNCVHFKNINLSNYVEIYLSFSGIYHQDTPLEPFHPL